MVHIVLLRLMEQTPFTSLKLQVKFIKDNRCLFLIWRLKLENILWSSLSIPRTACGKQIMMMLSTVQSAVAYQTWGYWVTTILSWQTGQLEEPKKRGENLIFDKKKNPQFLNIHESVRICFIMDLLISLKVSLFIKCITLPSYTYCGMSAESQNCETSWDSRC
jgi:hypothetical protein